MFNEVLIRVKMIEGVTWSHTLNVGIIYLRGTQNPSLAIT